MTQFELEVESVLGQFCFAFGAGAERTRVGHDTIRALQSRYRGYIAANFRTDDGARAWQHAKYHVLHYVNAMGAYAAALASQSGDATIGPEHFEVAARRFEAAAHRTQPRALRAGQWCPGGESERASSLEPKTEFLSASWTHVGA